MKLIKHERIAPTADRDGVPTRYTLEDINELDLAKIQLALVNCGMDPIRLYRPSEHVNSLEDLRERNWKDEPVTETWEIQDKTRNLHDR